LLKHVYKIYNKIAGHIAFKNLNNIGKLIKLKCKVYIKYIIDVVQFEEDLARGDFNQGESR